MVRLFSSLIDCSWSDILLLRTDTSCFSERKFKECRSNAAPKIAASIDSISNAYERLMPAKLSIFREIPHGDETFSRNPLQVSGFLS